jgi:hypothetical protein
VLEAARLFEIKRLVYTSAKGVGTTVTGERGHPTFKPARGPSEESGSHLRLGES